MSARRLAGSALTLAVGYAVTGGLFWLLLSVPESTVLALLGSVALVIAVAAAAGLTTAAAVAIGPGAPAAAVLKRAMRALPLFLLGLAIFVALRGATGAVDDWWSRYRGEIDAVFLRYLGMTGTAPLHKAEAWLTWTLRWGLGLSVVAGLVVAGSIGAMRAVTAGLRLSIRLAPLAAAILGVVLVSEGLGRLAYWRPPGLPPSFAELAFVAGKLGVLYLTAIMIVTLVLDVHRRAALRAR